MKIEQISIEKLIPYSFNNKKHSITQVNHIANSIKEFGFNQPIVIDEDNVVLVGHGRLEAAKKLGLETVPVYKHVGLTETQKKAYRILDNKLAGDAEWDFDNIKVEFDFLEEQNFPFEDFGLDFDFLNEEPVVEVSEDDFVPEIEDESYIKTGDLIRLGRHTVLCGDCTTDFEDLNCPTIDLVITDPPYGVSYVGKTKDALEIENDSLDEEGLEILWDSCVTSFLPMLKGGGVIYATVPAGPLKSVFVSVLKKHEILRQELVWLKDSMVLGRSDYHYKHEPILYGWKPGAAHYMTPDRTKTSVLEFARPKRSAEHPTMKPIALWSELIQNSSRKGQVVYDPFLGSGTTLIAAEQTERVCYGIELSPNYCQVIIERYKKYCIDNNKKFESTINGTAFDGETGAEKIKADSGTVHY